MTKLILLLPGAALLAALACGGGGGGSTASGPPATVLAYTSPAADAAQWQLVEDSAASTTTHLVLDLMAPSGAAGIGVTAVLTLNPAQARWSSASGAYATQTLFQNPKVDLASVSSDQSQLRILLGQPAGTAAVTYGDTPVVQVAMDLAASATQSSAVTLTATQGGQLAGSPTPGAITIQVGTLQTQ